MPILAQEETPAEAAPAGKKAPSKKAAGLVANLLGLLWDILGIFRDFWGIHRTEVQYKLHWSFHFIEQLVTVGANPSAGRDPCKSCTSCEESC